MEELNKLAWKMVEINEDRRAAKRAGFDGTDYVNMIFGIEYAAEALGYNVEELRELYKKNRKTNRELRKKATEHYGS